MPAGLAPCMHGKQSQAVRVHSSQLPSGKPMQGQCERKSAARSRAELLLTETA